ncbi:hypothetical protein L484_011764 [Morus notabilis]|uniref:Glabrous enhancer-binding protein-like DBD domain-containing protein n=1 Tax=Morus notabilis TaxID=981085 RepID=W9SBT1_9ROSA|nr:hypothetical protein L484_011764 [Morus notabilis]
MTTSNSDPPHLSSPPQSPRVFSESDEVHLLKTFRKISKSSSCSSFSNSPSSLSSLTITSQHLDLIESSLGLRFSHTQIIDKLRRLKLKYHRQARTKSLIRTHHDLRLHRISRSIWGRININSAKRHIAFHQEKGENNTDAAAVGLEDFPFLKEEFSRILPENGVWKQGLKCLGAEKMRGFNEEWMLVRKEEAELRAKRAELEKELIHLLVPPFGSSSIS